MKRKIAVILVAGIDRFKELIARDEEGTLNRLAAHRRVLEAAIARHDGRIFNTAGDAVLVEFQSAVEAVRCACVVQKELRAVGGNGPQLRYVMGITIGDVVQQGSDLLGDGVNVAARLQGIQSRDGIAVSRSVYEHVAAKLPLRFVDSGLHMLKNLPEPVHAYTVDLDGKPEARPSMVYGRRRRGLALLAAIAAGVLAIGGLALATYVMRPRAVPEPTVVEEKPQPGATGTPSQPSAASRADRCSEILERIQLGRSSREDRLALQTECR